MTYPRNPDLYYPERQKDGSYIYPTFWPDVIITSWNDKRESRNARARETRAALKTECAYPDTERLTHTDIDTPVTFEPLVPGYRYLEGTIVKFKMLETAWGPRKKVTLELDHGHHVWGTLPAALSSCSLYDRVGFHATLTQVDEVGSFAFYSNPTGARKIEHEQP